MPDLHFNTPALEKIVSKYNWATRTGAFNRDDLRQVALEAVERAKLRFDPTRGKAFQGFAWLCASQAVGEYANEQRLPVRVPNITRWDRRVKGRAAPAISAASTTVVNANGGSDQDLLDMTGHVTDDRTDEQLDAHRVLMRTRACVAHVAQRHAGRGRVLAAYYFEGLTLAQIAAEFGGSRQNVQQHLERARADFARAWAAAGWDRP